MQIADIVARVNHKLAGELLTYGMLMPHLDDVIDDINTQLDAKFPSFSDFTAQNFPDNYPDYNFFPDSFIRSVLIIGTACKFYETDEEGISTAEKYDQQYRTNMYYMVRDYSMYVPEQYQKDDTGYVPFEPKPTRDTNWYTNWW